MNEIEKITKEEIPNEKRVNHPSKRSELKKSGFFNLTELSACPGIGSVELRNPWWAQDQTYKIKNDDFTFGFRTVNGYQFSEHFSLGVGIGLDKYRNGGLLPISLDARATILKGKVSPVFVADIGYSVGLNGVSGGMVINPSIGIKTYVINNVAYLFNIGYKWQTLGMTYLDYKGNDKPYEVSYQFITVSTGFLF
jgi:hypothetical protein